MKKTSLILTVFVLVLLSAQLFAGGFQLNEHGARAMAQGGAFTARAYDPSAIFFNPAGLSFQRGLKFMAGGTIIMPAFSFFGPTNLNSNMQSDMVSMVFTPPSVYLTNTWTDGVLKGLGVGVGLVTPYGLGSKWEDDWIGKSITQETTLQTFYLMPTVAYMVNDWIAVGAGANIVFSNVKLRKAITNFDPAFNLDLEGDGKTAYSWNAGVLLKPWDDISFGFTYRAQTKIDFSGTAKFDAPATLAAMFPGGDVTTAITAPATFYAGIAWSPMKDLELEFDYQGIQWSSYDKLDINFAVNSTNTPGVAQSNQSSAKNYKDTYILRFGGEYKLPFLGLKLRAGWLYDANPVPDEHLEPMLPDMNRHGLNIGFGYNILPNLTMDVAYLHMFFQDRATSKTTIPDGVAFDGLYRGTAELIGVNFTYEF